MHGSLWPSLAYFSGLGSYHSDSSNTQLAVVLCVQPILALFFFFILLLKLNVLLQGVRLVLQWKLQVHFILNIRAFELTEGEKKRKGQNYIPISMSFSPTRPKRVPDLRYLCALFDLKLLKSMSNILGFHSREFFWTPENLSVMKSALPSRGSFQGRNIINPK